MAGVSAHCQAVIDDFKENPGGYCDDFRRIRSAAACYAWKYFEDDADIGFGDAMGQAWNKVKLTCNKAGFEV